MSLVSSTKGWQLYFLTIPDKENNSEKKIINSNKLYFYDAIMESIELFGLKEFVIMDMEMSSKDVVKETEGTSILLEKVLNLETSAIIEGGQIEFEYIKNLAFHKIREKESKSIRITTEHIGAVGMPIQGAKISFINFLSSENKERRDKFVKHFVDAKEDE